MSKHGGDIYTNTVEYDFSVNINPLGVPASVICAMHEAIDAVTAYPDPEYRNIRINLALLEKCQPEEVLCGNGASELLRSIISGFKNVLIPVPSFSEYEEYAGEANVSFFSLDEKNEFSYTEEFVDYLKSDECAGIDLCVLADPNNPNGKNIEADVLKQILDVCLARNITVLLDRCFYFLSVKNIQESSTDSMTDAYIINHYPNVYIVGAFTKSLAIPGIRIGYVLGREQLIDRLKKCIPEWNVSVVADAAGVAGCKCLSDPEYLSAVLELISEEKNYLHRQLDMLGIKTYESDANYILMYSDIDLYDACLQKGILIRDCSNFRGLRKGFYRIAVKTHKENELLIEALKNEQNRTCITGRY